MIQHLTAAAAFFLFASHSTAAPQRVVFQGDESEHRWALQDLNPNLPKDWTGYNYLVLEMKASSPQRFFLTFYLSGRIQRRQMHPLPNVWIQAAVPLEYFRRPNRAGLGW